MIGDEANYPEEVNLTLTEAMDKKHSCKESSRILFLQLHLMGKLGRVQLS